MLGLPVNTELRVPGASAVIYCQLEAKGIAFEGVVEALPVSGVDLRLFGKPESFTRRRMGVALATQNIETDANVPNKQLRKSSRCGFLKNNLIRRH